VVLPEIEGVNLADGLKRVAGNKRLYRDLLGQFVAKQGDAGTQISTALAGGDRQLAERIAHTVKGVSGNIGITGVQSAAQKLEKAIREGQDTVPALLAEFARLMDTQVRAIEQALRDSAPAPLVEARTTPFDGEAAMAAISRLKTLLEASDGDAEEAFRGLQVAVAGAVERQQLDALGASISDFDFEAALLKLDEFAEFCKQTEDQPR
jgi:HPt (histidine-containing phosphotransfer) domain-containing protein